MPARNQFDSSIGAVISMAERWSELVAQIQEFPTQLLDLTEKLSVDQLTTAHVEDEWTIAQVVHHLADSHAWGLRRTKKILTEDAPVISSYQQGQFAEMVDGKVGDIQSSLMIVQGTHARWAQLLESLSANDWERPEVHVEYGAWRLQDMVANYVRHGGSHLAQIQKTVTNIINA